MIDKKWEKPMEQMLFRIHDLVHQMSRYKFGIVQIEPLIPHNFGIGT